MNPGGRRTKGGLIQLQVSLAPAHVDALRAEAVKRMVEKGLGRPDASAVLREWLDERLLATSKPKGPRRP